MIFVFILACLAAGAESAVLKPIPSGQLAGIVTSFRQTLLEKIAVETKSTVAESEKLKTRIENECKPKINATVAKCKICAKEKCQKSPTFTDIIKLANPYLYLKGPMDDIAGKITDAYDLVGDKIAPFVNSMKKIGTSIPNEIKDIFKKINVGLEKMYKTLKLEQIGAGIVDVGKIIVDDFKDLGKKIGGIFSGRRRRRSTMSAETRQCMEKCTPCKPLLFETEAEIVAAVCGSDIAKANKTLIDRMLKIKNVFDHVVDKVNPILAQIKMDTTDMTNLELNNVVAKWFVNGKITTHKATKPVAFFDMGTPLALEYWASFP